LPREQEVLTMSRIVRPFACLLAVTGALALLPNLARAQFFPGRPEVVWPTLPQQIDSSVGNLPPLGKTSIEESVKYVFEWEKRDSAEMSEKDLAPLPWARVEVEPIMLSLDPTTADQKADPLWERRYPDRLLPIIITPRKAPIESKDHSPLVSFGEGVFH
jgi:hypothetical protein